MAPTSHKLGYRMTKAAVLAYYGDGSCACCGSTENLSIDHVAGNGAEHRKELSGRSGGCYGLWVWQWLIREGFPPGYQVLCIPCNSSKARGDRCRMLIH
jgi:hypothetical protein